MIQEHFCNYENSLALKKLGFDDLCLKAYFATGELSKLVPPIEAMKEANLKNTMVFHNAPLLTQAIQWLNSIKHTSITIGWNDYFSGWEWFVSNNEIIYTNPENRVYETWNQCAQDAIETSVKLIKEVKHDT